MGSFKDALLNGAVLVVLTAGAVTRAGNVAYLGQENDASSFRTTTVAKSFDPNGNNIYGEAGYVLYTTEGSPYTATPVFNGADPLTYNDGTYQTLSLLPSYLSLTNDGQNCAVGGYGYPLVDNPTATPGPAVPKVESGLGLNNNIPEGTEAPLVDINIGAGFPKSGLLIGVMLQPGGDAMSSVRLTQTAGTGSGSVTTSVAPLSNLTFEFFTLTGAHFGDSYTLYMINTSGLNPNVTYSGLTFDTLATVPEPASCGIFVSGMIIGLVRRRRA